MGHQRQLQGAALYCTEHAQLSMVLHNAAKRTFIQNMHTQCLRIVFATVYTVHVSMHT